jgi:hypothetical protein
VKKTPVMAVASLLHFARQCARTRKCGRPARKQTSAAVEWRSSSDRRTSQARRSAAADSFYFVLFAPASSEQAFCSLECESSQVVIDCVSEADIFLLMQEQ